MPTLIQVVNRYVRWDNVADAAITFDQQPIGPQTPRTAANGSVRVRTEDLADGAHVMHVTPRHTSTLPFAPAVAENLAQDVTRMFRSLDVNVTVRNGRIQTLAVPAAQSANGIVGAGGNPVRVQLQPLYHRSPHQNPNFRRHENITLIVIHQTAGSANIGGTLNHFATDHEDTTKNVSAQYVISAEALPHVVKVVQDSGRSWHTGDASWEGKDQVNDYSIGIELSHAARTPWPPQQITALVQFLELLLTSYPSIQRDHVVGHNDIKKDPRECPGLEFDWAELESHGLGLVPRSAVVSLDSVYGGLFRLRPGGDLRAGDRDSTRTWGGRTWPAPGPAPDPTPAGTLAAGAVRTVAAPIAAALGAGQAVAELEAAALRIGQPLPTTVTGEPIKELQNNLKAIGYFINVNGRYDERTRIAVRKFQDHFFSGTRRNLVQDSHRGRVTLPTAEFIERVRPVAAPSP